MKRSGIKPNRKTVNEEIADIQKENSDVTDALKKIIVLREKKELKKKH